jgi:hypothetical protein
MVARIEMPLAATSTGSAFSRAEPVRAEPVELQISRFSIQSLLGGVAPRKSKGPLMAAFLRAKR